jgi:hypothetical protein
MEKPASLATSLPGLPVAFIRIIGKKELEIVLEEKSYETAPNTQNLSAGT